MGEWSIRGRPITLGVLQISATLAGVGVGLGLDGIGAFDGSPSMPAAIAAAVMIVVGVVGFAWAIRQRWSRS